MELKDIIDCEDDYLILELPINRAVRVNLVCQADEKQEIEDGRQNEYITKASESYQRLIRFIQNENTIHGNCPECKVSTYYRVEKGVDSIPEELGSKIVRCYTDEQIDYECYIPDAEDMMRNKAKELTTRIQFFDKKFRCPKCMRIYQVSYALEYHEEQHEDNSSFDNEIVLIKVGQYPSLQEFSVIDFRGLNRALDSFGIKEDYRRALRNHTDGDNIASYVYLRRIIESIINKAYLDNKKLVEIDEEKFKMLRTKEKIGKLKEYLPKFLYENKEIYSIVSAGIHSLTEEQCMRYYDIIKSAVDIILYQEQARKEEEKLIKETTKGIQMAVSEIEK